MVFAETLDVGLLSKSVLVIIVYGFEEIDVVVLVECVVVLGLCFEDEENEK